MDRKTFSCTECDSSYAHKRSLNRHKKDVHGDKQLEKVKDFTCQINENDIKQEMEINNYMDRKICYKCDKCNKVTRQYFCLKCGKGYSRKSGVNQHMKTAHEAEKSDILDDVKCNDGDEEINTKIHIIIEL